jgi:hypothetical protein
VHTSSPGVAGLGLAALFAAFCLGLALVGAVAWNRTRAIRHGSAGGAGPASARTSTSPATFLPALAGAAALAAGSAMVAARRAAPLGIAVAGAGVFIAVSGLAGRVTELDLSESGLSIRYAGRTTFSSSWREVLALRSPRTPLAGWRLETACGRRTLMPSDIVGNEALLVLFVAWAGLEFDGRRSWRRTGVRKR